MAVTSVTAVPNLILDDGVWFVFGVNTVSSRGHGPFGMAGFIHTPSDTSDLSTWVETLKYGSRNEASVEVWWESDVSNNIEYTNPAGVTWSLTKVYSVSG